MFGDWRKPWKSTRLQSVSIRPSNWTSTSVENYRGESESQECLEEDSLTGHEWIEEKESANPSVLSKVPAIDGLTANPGIRHESPSSAEDVSPDRARRKHTVIPKSKNNI